MVIFSQIFIVKLCVTFSQMRLLSQTVPNFDQMYIYVIEIKNILT